MRKQLAKIYAVTASRFAMLLTGMLFTTGALSLDLSNVKEGDVIEVALKDLRPTQPSVGYDQVYYKLGRFQRDTRKLFDEICENNGAKGIKTFSANSNIRDMTSFTCEESVGNRKKEMKTIVIAPNNGAYLTDGHHTFNVYWHMENGGADFRNHVVVARDYRGLDSMEAFWQQMQADGNVWLYNHEGNQITAADLPSGLGLNNFNNDPYRALMYFSRGIAWHKPERITNPDTGKRYDSIPYVEFYWTREVRQAINLSEYDLNSRRSYNRAIRAVSDFVLKLESNDIGGSGRSAKSMGQYSHFNQQEFDKINRPDRGKLSHMLHYKSQASVKY